MPNPLISHQAPTLLIKIRFPKKFDGVALCIGAMVPDLNGIIDTFTVLQLRNISHSLLGLFIWVLPITLILSFLFTCYIGPWISKFSQKKGFIPKLLNYFGFNEFHYLKKKKFNRNFFIIASYSAILGGFTHLLLDLPSHEYVELFYPWMLLYWPDLLQIPLITIQSLAFGPLQLTINQFTIIWIIEDIIFLIFSLFILRHLKKHKLLENWSKKTAL